MRSRGGLSPSYLPVSVDKRLCLPWRIPTRNPSHPSIRDALPLCCAEANLIKAGSAKFNSLLGMCAGVSQLELGAALSWNLRTSRWPTAGSYIFLLWGARIVLEWRLLLPHGTLQGNALGGTLRTETPKPWLSIRKMRAVICLSIAWFTDTFENVYPGWHRRATRTFPQGLFQWPPGLVTRPAVLPWKSSFLNYETCIFCFRLSPTHYVVGPVNIKFPAQCQLWGSHKIMITNLSFLPA